MRWPAARRFLPRQLVAASVVAGTFLCLSLFGRTPAQLASLMGRDVSAQSALTHVPGGGARYPAHERIEEVIYPTTPTLHSLEDEAPPKSAPSHVKRARISIFIIWEGSQFPYPALVNFFASFRANAPLVDLVWVGIRRDEGEQCLDITPYAGVPPESNVRSVCLTLQEYYTAHVDYFCPRWGCTPADRDDALHAFMERHHNDVNKAHFRIWRGYIFRKYMDPAADWWGWADTDTFMGSFESLFPWDVAQDYDVIGPAHPTIQLYTRGHLTFMQTRPETEEKMNEYENMRTLQNFIYLHKDVSRVADEGELSAFMIRNPHISFLLLPYQLAETMFGERRGNMATLSTLVGTYTTDTQRPHPELSDVIPPFPDSPVLRLPVSRSAFVPTFSAEGILHPIDLLSGGDSWMAPEFKVSYEPDWALALPSGSPMIRLIGRGGGFAGGTQGVWERLELARPTLVVVAAHNASLTIELREGLYVHFFRFKHDRREEFMSIPKEVIGPNEVFVEYHDGGSEIWDNDQGQVKWRSALAASSP